MPRFSILLPTHNRADVIGFAIASALEQSEADFEILVAGDGCTDRTADVVASFDDSRIRWFDLPKAPFFGYANRNVALKQARGDVIAFLAHDDLWFRDHLELLGHEIEMQRAEWIYSLPLWVSPDGVVVPGCGNLRNPDELAAFLTVGNFIPASCIVHRKSCFEKYGFWPEDVASAADWTYWLRIIEGGSRQNLGYLPTPTTLHFKANWRVGRDSGMSAVGTLLEVADQAMWWPDALKIAIPAGRTEQSAIWDLMKGGNAARQAEMRRGVARAIERLARDAVEQHLPRMKGIERSQEGMASWIRRSLKHGLPPSPCLDGYPGGPERFAADLDGLRSSPDFDPAWYLATNPDVAEAGIDPTWHYLVAGRTEGRRGCPHDRVNAVAPKVLDDHPPSNAGGPSTVVRRPRVLG